MDSESISEFFGNDLDWIRQFNYDGLGVFWLSVLSHDIIHGILIVTTQNVKMITTGPKMMMNRMMMNIYMIEPNGMKRNINSLFHINPRIGQLYLLHQKIRPPKKSLHQK
ncbi:hypothetical protein R3W88_000936 [Solanum pinnatisectum]|uniref:Uncharacterized protein n=1 Tax=Solanum pinnatisectum TaxID=50273 RepID=A0AAV9MJS4_9SOLN|nr:hypothetical protein R3W88_000936 [Solanum pinnatisectum]